MCFCTHWFGVMACTVHMCAQKGEDAAGSQTEYGRVLLWSRLRGRAGKQLWTGEPDASHLKTRRLASSREVHG